ncbi:hypothetical protein Clacol_006418 [Clathrus columnatus]|uniref:Haloacid dehalogenase n=1 Tax=Clathrus columnatus TaxID=1419009 RepID=A0AAV5AET8_9AGAM|nr:hypothetical protein Clacol_006418 [Clathrus columnatus]
MPASSSPHNIQALLFDVFGTVVDWHGHISSELSEKARGSQYPDEDWSTFATEWRAGYKRLTKLGAETGNGPKTVDEMHQILLDEMLESPRWSHLRNIWNASDRRHLVLAWHRLPPWHDSVPALNALKQRAIIATLSNGNTRLLIDMAKNANLPWDAVFSSQLFDSYKPNPKVYQGAVNLLDLPTENVALVAAHIYDCAAAKAAGLQAIYVRRPTEDHSVDSYIINNAVQSGQADYIVDDFWGIVSLLTENEATQSYTT